MKHKFNICKINSIVSNEPIILVQHAMVQKAKSNAWKSLILLSWMILPRGQLEFCWDFFWLVVAITESCSLASGGQQAGLHYWSTKQNSVPPNENSADSQMKTSEYTLDNSLQLSTS